MILKTVPGKHDWSNHCLHFPISYYADYVCQLHWPSHFHKKKKNNLFGRTALMIVISLSFLSKEIIIYVCSRQSIHIGEEQNGKEASGMTGILYQLDLVGYAGLEAKIQ